MARRKLIAVPEKRTLQLSNPRLGALDAWNSVRTVLDELGPGWFLSHVATAGNLDLDGCLPLQPSNCFWDFSFFKLQQRDYISVALFSSGFLNFRSHTKSPESDLEPIKGTWLDSREIASAIRMEPDRSNVASKTLWMALRALDDGSLLWQVVRNSQDAALRIIHRTTFYVDALDGEILTESYERTEQAKKVLSIVRHRWKGGDWEDADSGGGSSSIH